MSCPLMTSLTETAANNLRREGETETGLFRSPHSQSQTLPVGYEPALPRRLANWTRPMRRAPPKAISKPMPRVARRRASPLTRQPRTRSAIAMVMSVIVSPATDKLLRLGRCHRTPVQRRAPFEGVPVGLRTTPRSLRRSSWHGARVRELSLSCLGKPGCPAVHELVKIARN